MPNETPVSTAPAAAPTQTQSTPAPEQVAEASEVENEEATPEEAAAEQAIKAEAEKQAARIKKLKLKVDGKDLEETVNLDDDEYLTRQLQLAKAAQKRMGEYAELERNVKSFIEELKKNPAAVLSNPAFGIDLKRFAAEVIEQEIANSKKSPEQLEKERLEKELKAIKDQREREKKEFEEREFQRLQEQEYERYDMLISNAIEKSDLPKSPYVVKKMAEYMLMGLQNNMDVTPDDVLPLVRDEIMSDIKDMFGVMPEEVIEKIIGKDVFNKIRKKNLAKAKAAKPAAPKPSAKDSSQAKKDEPKKKQTFKDLFGF